MKAMISALLWWVGPLGSVSTYRTEEPNAD